MFIVPLILLAFAPFLLASPHARASREIRNVVVFGDSYSDDCNRWKLESDPAIVAPYAAEGACPPPPTGRSTGILQWPEVLRNRTGWGVYNYAYAGATCSNRLFPRTFNLDYKKDLFAVPDIGNQISRFSDRHQLGRGNKDMTAKNTVAALFIGANDLGFWFAKYQNSSSFDVLPPGVTLNDEAQCLIDNIKALYDLGFRRILLLEMIPLELAAYFSYDRVQGYGVVIHQDGKLVSRVMQSFVTANNALQSMLLGTLSTTLRGLEANIFPTYSLFNDIAANPKQYLGPNADATGFCLVCPDEAAIGRGCTICKNILDKVWFDSLHPGYGVQLVYAAKIQEFLQGLRG